MSEMVCGVDKKKRLIKMSGPPDDGATAVSILADLALMSVPVTLFRSLKLPTRTKVGVVLLCCLGVL